MYFSVAYKSFEAVDHSRCHTVLFIETEPPKINQRGTGDIENTIWIAGNFHRLVKYLREPFVYFHRFVIIHFCDDRIWVEGIQGQVELLQLGIDFIR